MWLWNGILKNCSGEHLRTFFLSFATLTSVLLNDLSVLGCFEACWSSLRTSCPGEFIWRHEARVSQRSESHSATGPNRQPGDAAVVQAHPQPALRRKLQSPGTNSSITVMLVTFSLKERNTYLGMFLTSHVNKQITQYEFAGGWDILNLHALQTSTRIEKIRVITTQCNKLNLINTIIY